MRAWREAHPEYREYMRQWRAANKEKLAEYSERHKPLRQKWKKENPGRVNESTARRKLTQKTATPAWADMEKIKAVYARAAKKTRETGESHHVDHIVPLRGKNVCGLHVENNLRVVKAEVNLKKSYKHK